MEELIFIIPLALAMIGAVALIISITRQTHAADAAQERAQAARDAHEANPYKKDFFLLDSNRLAARMNQRIKRICEGAEWLALHRSVDEITDRFIPQLESDCIELATRLHGIDTTVKQYEKLPLNPAGKSLHTAMMEEKQRSRAELKKIAGQLNACLMTLQHALTKLEAAASAKKPVADPSGELDALLNNLRATEREVQNVEASGQRERTAKQMREAQ